MSVTKVNRLSSYWGNIASGHGEVNYNLLLPRGQEEHKEFERSIKKHIDFIIDKTKSQNYESADPFYLFLVFYLNNCKVPYGILERIAFEVPPHPQMTHILLLNAKFPVGIFLTPQFMDNLRSSNIGKVHYMPLHSAMINGRQKDIWEFINTTLVESGFENPESMPDEWIKKILNLDPEISLRTHNYL